MELVDYHAISVLLLEARSRLSSAIAHAKATLTDPEKITGKWNKDDKVHIYHAC